MESRRCTSGEALGVVGDGLQQNLAAGGSEQLGQIALHAGLVSLSGALIQVPRLDRDEILFEPCAHSFVRP
jgi:hypothetical protein